MDSLDIVHKFVLCGIIFSKDDLDLLLKGVDSVKIAQLSYILKIAETKSMSKAANLLYVSKQNMATALKSLEDELGVTIFRRTSKGMTLTTDGEKVLRYAEGILAIYEKMQSIRIGDSLALSFHTYIDKYCFPELIDDYKREYPNVKLTVTAETDLENIIQEICLDTLDVAVVNICDANVQTKIVEMERRHGLNIDILMEDNALLLSHKKSAINKYSDLADHPIPIVSLKNEEIVACQLLADKFKCDILPVSNTDIYRSLIESGLAVGFTSHLLIQMDPDRYSSDISVVENDVFLENPKITTLIITADDRKFNEECACLINQIKVVMKKLTENL